jgi:hypothetical protein
MALVVSAGLTRILPSVAGLVSGSAVFWLRIFICLRVGWLQAGTGSFVWENWTSLQSSSRVS